MAKTQKQLDSLNEKTQLRQLQNYQNSELVALAKVLRDQGLSDSEINAQVKAEKNANKVEYTDAKTTLAAPGVQNLFTTTDANGNVITAPVTSNSNTYSGDVAAGVTVIIDNAREFASTHGIQDVNQIGGDGTYTGVPLDELTKFTVNQNPDGTYNQGSGESRLRDTFYKTLVDASTNYGKSFSADELGNLQSVGTDANGNPIFKSKIAGSDQASSYATYTQNPDGTYTNAGYLNTKRPPPEKGNFISNTLSKIDDLVNDVVPGGWLGAAALAGGAYFAPEILGATEGAAGVGAGTTGTVAGATEAATTGLTDYLGSTALGDATTGAVGKGLMGTGLNAGTLAGAAGGTGITMPSLSTLGTLGGTAGMLPGTAGLTAEQLATATELGKVGTNAASGLGYLGGASALPAGTAGITGVTGASNVADVLRKVSDLYKGTKGLSMPSAQSNKGLQLAQLVRSNENPFYTPKDTTTLANPFATNQPVYIGTQLIK